MSWELMRAVLTHSRSHGTARTVLLAMAWYPPPGEDLAWPSNETLKADWGLDERTAQRALRSLEKLGELRRRPGEESFARRRVYAIDPQGSRQLSLLEGVTPVKPPVSAPVTSRGRGKGSVETLKSKTPPDPPEGGEERGDDRRVGREASDRELVRSSARRRRDRRRQAVLARRAPVADPLAAVSLPPDPQQGTPPPPKPSGGRQRQLDAWRGELVAWATANGLPAVPAAHLEAALGGLRPCRTAAEVSAYLQRWHADLFPEGASA